MNKGKLGFGDRLNELLSEQGFPARARAKAFNQKLKFGVSDAAVHKWLDGSNCPNNDRLQAIADFFEVNFKWLMLGEGEKVPSNIQHVHFSNKERTIIRAFQFADMATQKSVKELLGISQELPMCA
jgi:hypothetical protein